MQSFRLLEREIDRNEYCQMLDAATYKKLSPKWSRRSEFQKSKNQQNSLHIAQRRRDTYITQSNNDSIHVRTKGQILFARLKLNFVADYANSNRAQIVVDAEIILMR
uniref:Uncharacterized protein n=1 Tax=Romanomermis culicivorax TaxID=13658 RepID=A0A915JMW5_ROMCU